MPNPLLDLEKADNLLTQGAFASALACLQRLRVPGADPFLRGEILYKKAEALQALSRFAPALGFYIESSRAYTAARAGSEATRARLGASACLRVLSRYPEARALWKKSSPDSADTYLEAGLVERGLGNFPAARGQLKRAIAGARRAGDAAAERHAWWALGGTERFSGRFPQALQAFTRAEKKARVLKDRSAWAYALCGSAGMLRVLGHGKTSSRKYRAAYGVFVKEKDLFGQAYGLCGLANAARTFGDAAKTLNLYERSARLYRRLGDTSSEGFAHWGLGGSLRRLKRWRLSAAAYARARRLFARSGDARGAVMTQLGLSRLAADQRQPGLARTYLRGAVALAGHHKLPYETALARAELTRLAGGRKNPLSAFGIAARLHHRWRDIP